MNGSAYDQISRLSREDLETFAVRAAIEMRLAREQQRAGDRFASIVAGFMLGALAAVSAVVLGVLLS